MNTIAQTILCLQGVTRWSRTHTLNSENVASHSYEVAMFSWVLAQYMNDLSEEYSGPKVDVASVVMSALTHDLVESITGDVITPTKALIGKDEYKRVERKAEGALIDMAPEYLQKPLEQAVWTEGGLVKDIVKVCDRFCAASFAAKEVRCGNVEMKLALERSLKSFFDEPLADGFLKAIGVDMQEATRSEEWLAYSIDEAVHDMLTKQNT